MLKSVGELGVAALVVEGGGEEGAESESSGSPSWRVRVSSLHMLGGIATHVDEDEEKALSEDILSTWLCPGSWAR